MSRTSRQILREPCDVAIGATRPWNQRSPSGTSRRYSQNWGRPVSRTFWVTSFRPSPTSSPITSPWVRPRSWSCGAEEQLVVGRPNSEVGAVLVELEDQVVKGREEGLEPSLAFVERFDGLLRFAYVDHPVMPGWGARLPASVFGGLAGQSIGPWVVFERAKAVTIWRRIEDAL